MAKLDLPTIGVWLTHFPTWYEEPKEASIHLIGQEVRNRSLDKLPVSAIANANSKNRLRNIPTRTVRGEHVLNAVEELLY